MCGDCRAEFRTTMEHEIRKVVLFVQLFGIITDYTTTNMLENCFQKLGDTLEIK